MLMHLLHFPRLLWAALLLAAAPAAQAQFLPVEENPYGQRPVIIPVPDHVAGVAHPVLSLDEGWLRKESPQADFYAQRSHPAGFEPFTLVDPVWATRTPDAVVGFWRTVRIPEAFAGQRSILRFDGTAHAARLWVNGRPVRSHWGSYTSWTADITDFVTPGQDAVLALELDERPAGLAAFVRFSADIHGSVRLYAVPQTHFQRLRVHTDFDADLRDARLTLWMKFPEQSRGSVQLSLTGPDGKRAAVSPGSIRLPEGTDEFRYAFTVRRPVKWDAEHPNLYRLTLTLKGPDGKVLEVLERKVGFRKIERRGNQLFVNGQEVKFRGIWGPDSIGHVRYLNANHIRHKYATEALLDSCDRLGVYVLHENPVDFAKFRDGESPAYAHQWLELLADMMERDYSHPSVVMWGLGNESFHGDYVLQTHRYAKFDDPDRQTMFSWANRIRPDEEIPYDIYSFHYGPFADPSFDPSSYGVSIWHSPSLLLERRDAPAMPVMIDESTHVVISSEEAGRDPNVRNFWGESIKEAWDRSYHTKGSLGLDQFGMFTDMPAWDMPEQWLMRKAYSPFVIRERAYANPGAGKPLEIEVENRFSHTNLREVSIVWKVGSRSGRIPGPDAAPGQTARFRIPYTDFRDGDTVELAIRRADGFQVDEYRLEVGRKPFRIPAPEGPAPVLQEKDGYITITGQDFVLTFDRYAGQITSLVHRGETVLTGGPHLQLLRSGLSTGEFWPQSVSARTEGNEAVIDLDVIYSPIAAAFSIRIDGKGRMAVSYTIKRIPDPAPRSTTLPWQGADLGGYSEVGVTFSLPRDVDRIRWDRKGLWTTYPEDHPGREQGIAYKTVEHPAPRSWKDLDYDFNWMGGTLSRPSRVSNDFRASKEYIRTADVLLKDSVRGIRVLSEEKDAVRLGVQPYNGTLTLYVNNLWNYPTLGVGNWMKPAITVGEGYSNTVYLGLIND